MFNWLSQMPLSHFGVLNPNYKRGWYTGTGRAWYLLENIEVKFILFLIFKYNF